MKNIQHINYFKYFLIILVQYNTKNRTDGIRKKIATTDAKAFAPKVAKSFVPPNVSPYENDAIITVII